MYSVLPKLIKVSIFSFIFLTVLLNRSSVYAQNDPKIELRDIVRSVNQFTEALPPEKVYLQTDRSSYAIGDTIWFKAYLFDAASLSTPRKSGVLYVEIADEQNLVVKRFMVSMFIGLGWGDIAIVEKDMPQGYYTLRAYTNWMLNFDDNYIFKKQLYIGTPVGQDVTIKSRFDVKPVNGKQNASIDLMLTQIDQQKLIGYKDFALKITEGTKIWYKDKVESSVEGALDFNFNIPDKADPDKLDIILQDSKAPESNPQYRIPLLLNRPEKIDLQFMPEGGNMVEGLDSHIAFKALSEDGNGTNVSGAVYNSKQVQVASFQSTHRGMGVFNLHVQPGETYTARIKLPSGEYSKAYPLPAVKHSGIALNVVNHFGSDSLEVSISSTADIQGNNVYYLVGQSRGVGCFGEVVRLDKPVKNISVSKTLFPTGIARLTLLTATQQPLNERIVYIDHEDNLRVNITSNKKIYTKRDNVALDIAVADKAGQPVSGSFSVSVTDDGQVKNDSISNNTLKSTLLLTSDLKGFVEDPGYYFNQPLTDAIARQLDNLLLAQGWVNYDWSAVFKPVKAPLNPAEASFAVHGKVTNIFNKPVASSKIVLLAKSPSFALDTITDNTGQFNFSHLYPVDSAAYVIQARNKNGGSFNVGIDIDEFKAPVFNASNRRIIPWYINIDTTRLNALKTHISYKLEQDKLLGIHMLNEVGIVDKKVIKGSQNLNGPGGSDFALNEADLLKAGKMTLGDLLYKKVKGFTLGYGKHPFTYFINGQFMHLIIDGVDITPFFTNDGSGRTAFRDYVNTFLDYYTAEDIKGIEVMTSSQYVSAYFTTFVKDPTKSSPFDHAYVEVTTYAGKGPFLKKASGIALYRPVIFASKKQFYSPQYTTQTTNTGIDTRSTIYWSPNVVSKRDGKASISFYTADKPGTYTLMIEGTDMNGDIESTSTKLVVK
jgi:hypothetical protein